MENRRRDYRHPFSPSERLTVALTSSDATSEIVGRIVNLSIGGLCIESETLRQSTSDRWVARLVLADGENLATIRVERVYAEEQKGTFFGFRFLYPATMHKREEQEKVIWRFMLEMQRQVRHRNREAQRLVG